MSFAFLVTRLVAETSSATDSCSFPIALAASTADLVPEHAPNHGPGNRTRYVGRIAAIFHDLLALDPTALLGCTDHCANRRNRHFV